MTDYICELCGKIYKVDIKEKGLTSALFIHERSCKDGKIINAHVLRYNKWVGKESELKIIELPERSKRIEVLTDNEKHSMSDIEKIDNISSNLDKYSKRLGIIQDILSTYELKDNEKNELVNIVKECNETLLGGILSKEKLEDKIKTVKLARN